LAIFLKVFEANAFISPFNTQTKHICKVILNTTALQCFPKNPIPWRDSNPGPLIPEADAMSTAPRCQGDIWQLENQCFDSWQLENRCFDSQQFGS
jgi:hypothetical protein